MTTEMQENKKLADELYKKHGKHLESEHWGKYLAISPDGKTLLGSTLIEVHNRRRPPLARAASSSRSEQRLLANGDNPPKHDSFLIRFSKKVSNSRSGY